MDRRLGMVLLGTGIVLEGACSLLLDTSTEQCHTTADCVARGGPFAAMQCVNRVCVGDAGSDANLDAGPWACLGDVVFPAPTVATANVTVPIIDVTTKQPVTALQGKLCQIIDTTCTTPIQVIQPDDAGAHLQVPLPFDGYLELTSLASNDAGTDAAADASTGYPPALVFFNPPITHDATYTTTVLVTYEQINTLAMVENTSVDPTLGAVFMTTVDCDRTPAAGVSLTLDSLVPMKTQGFYFANGIPVLDAPATDSSGYAGFINTPLGTRTVTGRLQSTQTYIGDSVVFTLAGALSYTTIAPSP